MCMRGSGLGKSRIKINTKSDWILSDEYLIYGGYLGFNTLATASDFELTWSFW